MRAGPRPGPSRDLAGARAADGTGPGLGWGAARAQGSPRHRPAGLPLRGTCQKGKEQGLRASGLQAGWSRREGRGSGLQPSVSWHWSQPPAHLRQGHSNSFPFQPGKPPPCPHPALGCGARRERPGAPRSSPAPRFLFPARQNPGPPRSLGLLHTSVLGQRRKAQQACRPPETRPSPVPARCGCVLGPRGTLGWTPVWEPEFWHKGP